MRARSPVTFLGCLFQEEAGNFWSLIYTSCETQISSKRPESGKDQLPAHRAGFKSVGFAVLSPFSKDGKMVPVAVQGKVE